MQRNFFILQLVIKQRSKTNIQIKERGLYLQN